MARKTNHLEIITPVVVHHHHNGEWSAFPLADPDLVSRGGKTTGDPTDELALFLSDYLVDVPARELARFATMPNAELVTARVLLPRSDLPKRLQVDEPIDMPCVLLDRPEGQKLAEAEPDEGPKRREDWVLVLPLGHTLYVRKKDELHEVVDAEVKRMVAARETTAVQWLELLPAAKTELAHIEVRLDRSEQLDVDAKKASRRKLARAARRRQAVEVLESVGTPLHNRREVTHGPPLTGRADELSLVTPLLTGRDRLGVLLVGEESVGKTALVEGWLRAQLDAGKKPFVYATSGAQLIAGMSGFGQWQARVERVLEAAEELDAVLYFENLADIFGDKPGGHVNIAGALKPWLERGRVRIVSEMRPSTLDLFGSRHVGFFSLLAQVRVPEMSAEDTEAVLHERLAWFAQHKPHTPQLDADTIGPLIELTDRYVPYRRFPGKAVRLAEEVRAAAESDARQSGKLQRHHVYETFAIQSGIASFLLRDDRSLKRKQVLDALQKRIVGQDDATRRVADVICVVKANLQPPGKPLATFLFVGPTGVGKTELSRALAEFLFGSPDRMIRFDMSEYTDPLAAQRLIRGTDRAEGLLTRQVRQHPFCVVLLDEIEKAHFAVFDLLLQVCGEGRLTDARGQTAWFHNSIIIMTSNIGAAHRRERIGLAAESDSASEHYASAVRDGFRPEFVNRLDAIIPFSSLTPEDILAIARLTTNRLADRRGLAELGLSLDVDDGALSVLAAGGYSEAYGARALRRHLEQELVVPLARLIGAAGTQAQGATAIVRDETADVPDDDLVVGAHTTDHLQLVLRRGKMASANREVASVSELFGLRRELRRLAALETPSEVREHRDYLLSQLNYGRNDKNQRQASDTGRLAAEHARLDGLLQALDGSLVEVQDLEELALVALYDGEGTEDFLSEAADLERKFRRALLDVLVARQPRAREATIVAQQHNDPRRLVAWLRGLLGVSESLGWTITCHFDGDKDKSDQPWDRDLRWGPPRDREAALAFIDAGRLRNAVVVSGFGPLCGAVLAMEDGVHRWQWPSDRTDGFLVVRRVAGRAQLHEKEWLLPALDPLPPLTIGSMRALPATRNFKAPKVLEIVGGKRSLSVPTDEYWSQILTIALEHTLIYETDHEREIDELFKSPLDVLS